MHQILVHAGSIPANISASWPIYHICIQKVVTASKRGIGAYLFNILCILTSTIGNVIGQGSIIEYHRHNIMTKNTPVRETVEIVM